MKSFIFSLFTALLLFMMSSSVLPGAAYAQSSTIGEYVDGVVLVQLTPEGKQSLNLQKSGAVQLTGIAELDKLSADFGVHTIEPLFRTDPRFAGRHQQAGLDRWYRVSIASKDAGESMALVSELQKTTVVSIAEREAKHSLVDTSERRDVTEELIELASSNDPMLLEQWHYNNTGQTGGMPGADINLFAAWNKETGSNDVVVIVLDTGIDTDHPDLAESLWVNPNSGPENGYDGDVHGWNFVFNNAIINDVDGHGSHTSGTIAARSGNGVGVAGVAGGNDAGAGVKIMVAKTFAGGNNTAGGFAEAFVYGADNGAVIASNSWGGGGYSQALNDAIDYFEEFAGIGADGSASGPVEGGVVVFAAGNYGSNYPSEPIASNDDVIAVASTDHNDKRSGFSEYGTWIDLSAPGSAVLSTTPNETYSVFSGTSMAAPHVSGLAALIASYTPGISAEALTEQMIITGDNIDALNPGFEGMLGTRINAGLSLQEDDGIPPSDITDLAVAGSASQNGVTLTWTAPGSSGDEGQAFEYDLAYSTEEITSENFDEAMMADIGRPSAAGTQETANVKGLSPQTMYYFAIKARDAFGSESGISNVVTATTDGAPVISLSATQVSAEVEIGETMTKTITVSNSGEGTLNFSLPAFVNDKVMTNSDLAPLARIWEPAEGHFPNAAQGLAIRSVISGENTNPDANTESLVQQYQSMVRNGNSFGIHAGASLAESEGEVIEFENLVAQGGEVFNVTGEGFTGMLEVVDPDFMLVSGGVASWASDFAIYFVSVEDEEYEIELQVGGFGGHGPNLYSWHEGDSPQPGTSVTSPVVLNEALELDGLEVFIGNGWFSGPEATWDGQITLVGADTQTSFISSVTPSSGSLAPGESTDLEIVFDASDVVDGVYVTETDLVSNDLNNPEIELEFLMQTAGGEAVLVASDDELDFGSLFEGQVSERDLLITNIGTAIAEVTNVTLAGEMFSLEDFNGESGNYFLAPGESLEYIVSFAPDMAGAYEGTLTVEMADSTSLMVFLMGTATETPAISLDPDAIEITLPGGATGTSVFSIVNSGNGPLEFSIPSYFDDEDILTTEMLRGSKVILPVKDPATMMQVRSERELIRRYLAGEIQELDASQSAVIDQYLEMNSSNQAGLYDDDDHDGSLEPNGNRIEFENLTAGGLEFYQVNSGDFTGVLETVTADFVLDESEGSTWANDLTLLVTTSDEVFDESTFVLQIGGTTTIVHPENYYDWGMGHTSEPGTPVQTSIDLNSPLDVEELYFFLGNGWAYGNSGTWSGSITLDNVNSAASFITSVSPSFGTVPAGGSTEVQITFDSSDLVSGSYESSVSIESNVPEMPETSLAVTMNVTGGVSISVDPDFIDFGDVSSNQTTFRFLEIQNNGNGDLSIESVTTEGAGFTNGDFPTLIEPFSSELMKVFFNGSEVGSYSGTLTIASSDTMMAELTVPLSAEVIGAAEAVVTPIPVIAELEAGSAGSVEFQLQNTGDASLNFIFPEFAGDLFGGNTHTYTKIAPDAVQVYDLERYFSMEDRSIISLFQNQVSSQASPDEFEVLARYESIYGSIEAPFYGGGGDNGDGGGDDTPGEGDGDGDDDWNGGDNGEVDVEGHVVTFNDFFANSLEFVPISQSSFSGLISAVEADFEIVESTGQTWANDLTLLFSTSGTELTEESIILQVGGTVTIGSPEAHCSWSTGSSGQVGARVDEYLELTSEFLFEEIYVWIGHGWNGGHGVWSGELQLLDLTENGDGGTNPPSPPESFISSINPPVGFLDGGDSVTVTAGLDATGLEAGVYNSNLLLIVSSEENPVLVIPFELTVTDGPVEPDNDFALTILVEDQAGNDIPLIIGTAADATLDYDADYDLLAPPPPPDGAFDARLVTNGVSYFTSFIPTVADMNEWELQFVASSGNDPIVLTWDPANLPAEGNFMLTDAFGQGFVNVDMRQNSSFSLADASVPGLENLKIVQSTQMTMMFSYMDSWNMLSMPMYVNMDGYDSYYDMFPDGVEGSMYGFDGSYTAATEMTGGMGYWMAFNQAGSVPMTGDLMMSADIPLMEGWNMIGSVSYMGEITDPDNIVLNGTLYGFDGSYYTTTELEPGQGYWVAASAAGTVSLSVMADSPASLSSANEKESTANHNVQFSTGDQTLQTLHFGAELPADLHPYQLMLPPLPPNGSFDARLSGQQWITDSQIADIDLQQTGAPLTAVIRLENDGDAVVTFHNGPVQIERKTVESGQVVAVPEHATTMQIIPADQVREELPSEFALGQNYPNPFNPTTTIQFALPVESTVTLDVFNITGQHVATLVNGERQAGQYEVTFDASGLASGLYLYRLTAGAFSETRQFTLIK